MTIKEIAGLTGKTKRTVERWITCDKMSQETCDKMSQAIQTKKSADFTLDETIEILKSGNISESLISLLKENTDPKVDIRMERLESIVEKLVSITTDLLQNQSAILLKLSAGISPLQITERKDYASKIGEKIAEQIRSKKIRKDSAEDFQLFLFQK